MKKITLLFLLFLFLPAIAAAQEEINTDSRIFSIQTGFLGGYDLNSESITAGRDLGLFFPFSNNVQGGFRYITDMLSTGDALFLDVGFFPTPFFSVDLMVGHDGTKTAAGIDLGFTLINKGADDVFSSRLKIKAGYLFEFDNGIGDGVVMIGIIGTAGF